jgi:hypothetical protein
MVVVKNRDMRGLYVHKASRHAQFKQLDSRDRLESALKSSSKVKALLLSLLVEAKVTGVISEGLNKSLTILYVKYVASMHTDDTPLFESRSKLEAFLLGYLMKYCKTNSTAESEPLLPSAKQYSDARNVFLKYIENTHFSKAEHTLQSRNKLEALMMSFLVKYQPFCGRVSRDGEEPTDRQQDMLKHLSSKYMKLVNTSSNMPASSSQQPCKAVHALDCDTAFVSEILALTSD